MGTAYERGRQNSWIRASLASALALSVICFLTASLGASAAKAQHESTALEGTLRIRNLQIPPSEYWSPEFRASYVRFVSEVRATEDKSWKDPRPATAAPKAAWDKYDAMLDAYIAEPLASVRSRYSVEVVDTKIAGVRVGDISPKGGVRDSDKARVLINLHGGGFVEFRGLSFGELESIPVASMGDVRVVTLDYRQSPYFQYPAASEDVEAVYRAMLKEYKPESIGIFGCSAGGILTSQSVAWFQAKGLPKPGAIGIFGSGLSVSERQLKMGDSRMWGLGVPPEASSKAPNTLASVISSEALRWYMKDVSDEDSVAYPGSSDPVLTRFPATLFLTGTRELGMSLAIVGHARLLKLGVDSSLYLMEGAPHCAHVFFPGTPEAHDASAYIARWFDQHLAK